MKILFITAYFPPCQYGWGYMRICEQVADGLANLGHEIEVLTSTYQDGPEYKPYPIYRRLTIDPDWNLDQSAARQFFIGRRFREKQAVKDLHALVEDFHPDVIFVWHANNLSRVMLQKAENMAGIKTVYYFANYLPEQPDEYITYWQSTAVTGPAKYFKPLLSKLALYMLANEGKPIPLKYEYSISVSNYVRQRLLDQKLIGLKAIVIPNGVDLNLYTSTPDRSEPNGRMLKFIIPGRIAPEKGIHTSLLALAQLHAQSQLENMQLTIIGDGQEEYKKQLRQIIIDNDLDNFVRFYPPVPADEMPAILAQHDVLILPSEWNEPLACTMLEAMASHLLVMGTTTGGSSEVLSHEQTGLVFEPGKPKSLAAQLIRVLQGPDVVPQLAQAGQQEVRSNFNIRVTIRNIEEFLFDLAKGEH